MNIWKRKLMVKIFFLAASMFIGGELFAQEKQKSVKKQRKAFLELQEDRDAKAADKKEEERKKHQKIQTKETQKRMKKNLRRSKRLQQKKHEKNFFQRLFTKGPARK